MIEYMLSDVICSEFEKVVGKTQYKTRKAMHLGFSLTTGFSRTLGHITDQYRVCHMYIYAPCNYVHVAVQTEVIDEAGDRHVEPMEHLCYHDSCWRDTIRSFIFKNREDLSTFKSFGSLFNWYDVFELTKDEEAYLNLMDQSRRTFGFGTDKEKERLKKELKVNPFDKRGIWKD